MTAVHTDPLSPTRVPPLKKAVPREEGWGGRHNRKPGAAAHKKQRRNRAQRREYRERLRRWTEAWQ